MKQCSLSDAARRFVTSGYPKLMVRIVSPGGGMAVSSFALRRCRVLFAWLSIVIVVSGAFSWVPAAAEDPTTVPEQTETAPTDTPITPTPETPTATPITPTPETPTTTPVTPTSVPVTQTPETPTGTPLTPTPGTPVPTATATPGGSVYGTVSNTGGATLRCRTIPVSGATITFLAPGTVVPVRGETANGWVPVRCAGQDGWASAAYLVLGGTPPPTGDANSEPHADRDPDARWGDVRNSQWNGLG